MKKLLFLVSFFCFPLRFFSCPLCVGKIKADSPLFISDELYQPGKTEQPSIKSHHAHEQIKKLTDLKGKK